ncbi:YvrJ family protein [Bacillus testis]|uniref:YvrJ family protein n=1 Tax=Bacillus testis TaxID=1622072 RepID=UPI00094649EB|nr:YvrJ family protein [Bacillus testis]
MDEWISLISDVGFPIVVTLYLLYRIENKLNTLNDTMQNLPARFREAMTDRFL